MSEKYLFRAKACYNAEWLIGSLVEREFGKFQIIIHPNGVRQIISADPATIGLCSGIPAAKSYRGTSRHDLLIFEADVIVFGGEIYEIIFADACFWISQGDYSMELHTLLGQGDIEIIGNVHDKPTGASL